MPSIPSLVDLEQAWANHPLGRHRAVGGRRALDGFRYQLALSLERFFDRLDSGQVPGDSAFEGLSDLAHRDDDLTYLVQMKTTLRRSSWRHAVDEMLAIDAFLEGEYPALRPAVRFAVWCRRLESTGDLTALTAEELGLDDGLAERWRQLAPRVGPIEVRADPFLSLVVRYFGRLDNAFLTFEAMLGRLLRQLSEGLDSGQINTSLLDLWSHHRETREKPPGRLLAPQDFQQEDEEDDLVLVGDRPFLEDLRRGCFMPRRRRLDEVLEAIDRLLPETTSSQRRRRLPVVWIDGAPGMGKSVLLLQTLEELVNGRQLTVHRLSPSPRSLARALELWHRDDQPVIIAIDDIFAPTQRRREDWQEVHHAISDHRWQVLPLLLTCGPTDYREAFAREARREGTLRLETVTLTPLSEDERRDYGRWYGEHTGSPAPPVEDDNFATAAFLLQLTHRGEAPNVEQFAERLAERFRSQSLLDDMLVLLAANVLGIHPPKEVFNPGGDFLESLLREGVLRWVDEPRSLCMLHPRLATSLYGHLVPQHHEHERAAHLTRCFELLRHHVTAEDDLLPRLLPEKHPHLTDTVRRQALRDIGQLLASETPDIAGIGHLRQWLPLARRAEPQSAEQLLESLWTWLRQPDLASDVWSRLWQIGWQSNDGKGPPPQMLSMVQQAQDWLPHHFSSPAWNYIWQALWRDAPNLLKIRDRLVDLAQDWLFQQPRQRGWSYVFQSLFDGGLRTRPMLCAGLLGLRRSPISAADPHLWAKVWQLRPGPWAFAKQLLFRLADAPASLQAKGLDFLWDLRRHHLGRDDEANGRLAGCLEACRQQPRWPHLMQQSRLAELPARWRRPVIARWLTEHRQHDAWSYLWRNLLSLAKDDPSVFALGRDWLQNRQELSGWPHVWGSLFDRQQATEDELFAQGLDWLRGRQERAAWSHVWQRLLGRRPGHLALRQLGRQWLIDGDGRSQWNYVWKALVDDCSGEPEEVADVLLMGRQRLVRRADGGQWPFIWQRLMTADPEDTELRRQGRQWLARHRRRAEWPFVWQRLQELEPDIALIEEGRRWLLDLGEHSGWSFVWRRLVDDAVDVDGKPHQDLLDLGRRWLKGRESAQDWSQVWRRLLDSPLEDDDLLDQGRRWLRRRADGGDWNVVWEALALRFPWDAELRRLGEAWLRRQSPDRAAATFVHRRLRAMARLQG